MSLPPPTYSNQTGLSGFAKDLRGRVFDTQSRAAKYFGVSSATISRYEGEDDPTIIPRKQTIAPPAGYLARLGCLLVEKQQEPQVIGKYKTVLLEEME